MAEATREHVMGMNGPETREHLASDHGASLSKFSRGGERPASPAVLRVIHLGKHRPAEKA